MTLKKALLASVAMLATAGVADAAKLRGTYVSLEGGGSWVEGRRFFQDYIYSTSDFTYSEYRAEFDSGWALMGTVGYALPFDLRAELELGYRHNSFKELFDSSSSTIDNSGSLSEFSLMANLVYDIYLTDNLSISLGGGAGADLARLKVGVIDFSDEDWRFAWQGLAGVNYGITDRLQLFANYRYLHVDAPEYISEYLRDNPTTVPTTLIGTTERVIFMRDLAKQSVTVGLRYAFGGPDEPAAPPVILPPAPPPEIPPPPPAPPVAPKQFIVFFGFNKSNISAEAQQVINDAAATARQTGAAAISIIGHADTSGTPAYNDALSMRRASSVKTALVALGIPEGSITTTGKGETELLVVTGDGMKEPQNRRATIDLK